MESGWGLSKMKEDIAAVVQIDDPEIDSDALYARIRTGLAQHGPWPAIDFPIFERPRVPILQGDLFSSELVEQLERLNASFDQVWVELSIIERLYPVIGTIVNRVKRDLHQLVIYYVNQLGQRQRIVNEDIVRLVNRAILEIDAADLTALRRDLDHTNARLAELERQIESMKSDDQP